MICLGRIVEPATGVWSCLLSSMKILGTRTESISKAATAQIFEISPDFGALDRADLIFTGELDSKKWVAAVVV